MSGERIQRILAPPVVRVISFLIENNRGFSKTELARESGISRTTLFKIWGTLEEFNIVTEVGKLGKAKLYRLNKDNPVVKKFIELSNAISEQRNKSFVRSVGQSTKFKNIIKT